MISFDEAYGIVTSSAFDTGAEQVQLSQSYCRVLAMDIISDSDLPPFNRAAVDGYACRRTDAGNDLEVVEMIAAGKEPLQPVGKNQCSKIMTGAIVPDGCDFVFMVEDSQLLQSGKVRFTGSSMKSNISPKGEDVRKGDKLLSAGRIITPQDIAVMASLGYDRITVSRMPETGIISTGDELVEPGVEPHTGQIRNSNSYQLMAQVARAGGKARYYGIVPDTGDSALEIITRAIEGNDIVILTGGVSMGDFDFIPSFLARAGVNILFDRVNVQPGKPTTFGVHSKALVFGLPGNPVSSYIQFETLIRPLLHRMMGSDWKPVARPHVTGKRFERKSASRLGWIPVRINENDEAIPVEYHGSAHIAALSYSDGIIPVGEGVSVIEKGEEVIVRSFC
jgi:molybdopterin molybdotransferase